MAGKKFRLAYIIFYKEWLLPCLHPNEAATDKPSYKIGKTASGRLDTSIAEEYSKAILYLATILAPPIYQICIFINFYLILCIILSFPDLYLYIYY